MASYLKVEPAEELVFNGPFTEVSEKIIHLTNTAQSDVCFKVKTTAPRRYCVRPNCGIIEIGGQQDVTVLLQPFEYDPTDKNRHKFMVQCMELTAEERSQFSNNTEALFRDVEKRNPERISDKKLRCTFIAPTQAANGNGTDRGAAAGSSTNALTEIQRLEAELSQLRQELLKSKEDNARLGQTNDDLRVQVTRGTDQLNSLKNQNDSKGSGVTMTIVLMIITLVLGAALGIWFAPVAGFGGSS